MSIEARFHFNRGDFVLDAEFSIPSRGVTALFGRSGAGKTTLLRCLAGLEQLAGGRLVVDSEVWQDDTRFVATSRRSLGYVFQEPSLFPHLSVEGNLRFGENRIPVNERRVDFAETVELLGLGGWLGRFPDTLSGGQRQRVAIARALLTSPRLMLMDEPMGSLDNDSKLEILPWLERLHDRLAIPVVYVTHDIDEVTRLADTMILLDKGQVVAQGDLQTMLTRADLPLAQSELASAMLVGVVLREDSEYQVTEVQCGESRIAVARTGLRTGDTVRLRIQARDVIISLKEISGMSALNSLRARVLSVNRDAQAGHVLVTLDIGGSRLLSRITARSAAQLGLTQGQDVHALVKAVSIS